ncbi:MAG: PAS domain S-box protein, partial [Methanobacteriota archaeon]
MTEPIHILYVDDEPALLNIGKLFLERTEDFIITTLESACAAFDILNTQSFDAIISDYQMPEMDGIEFLIKVRNSGNTIPFILFTGRGREEVIIQALNEGADFYLQKGGNPGSQFAELAHKIRQAVKQRRLEASVSDHERREKDIINFLPDATFSINTEGIIIAWNRAMETLTGLSSSDMLGSGNHEYSLPFYHERRPLLIDLVLRDDPDVYSKYSTIKRDGDHLSAEISISHFHEGTGASFWFTASPLYDNQGIIVGAIESIREITESKRAEEALRLDESRLETLLKLNQMIGESVHDITNFALEEAVRLTGSTIGYIAFVNEDESMLTMHAWSREAMEECQVREKPLIYPVTSTGLWGESLRQRRPVITNDYAAPSSQKKGIPKGHVHLIRHLSTPIFDGDHIVAVVGVGNKSRSYDSSDIRQLELLMSGMWTIISRKQMMQELFQKHEELQAAYEEISATEEELRFQLGEMTRQEQALRERELKYRDIFENSVTGLFKTAPDGQLITANDALARMYGYSHAREIFQAPMNVNELYANPKDRKELLRILSEKGIVENFETTHLKQDGTGFWVSITARTIRDADGTALFNDGTIIDISPRKRAEEALNEANQKLRLLTGLTRHDIFNQLSALKGFHDLAMEESNPVKL